MIDVAYMLSTKMPNYHNLVVNFLTLPMFKKRLLKLVNDSNRFSQSEGTLAGVKHSKGFTLIELLIVVAIIGVLAAVGIPMFNGYITDTKTKATTFQHDQIVSFITASIVKCDFSGGKIKLLDNAGKDIYMDCVRKSDGVFDGGVWRNHMDTHFAGGLGWKNPWGTANPHDAGRPTCCRPFDGDGWIKGLTNIGTQDKYIIVNTDIDGTTENRRASRILGYGK